MRFIFVCWGLLICSNFTTAQVTAVYQEPDRYFIEGKDYFDKGMYAASQDAFAKYLSAEQPSHTAKYEQLEKQAEFYFAQSAVRLNQTEGESLVLAFIQKNRPDPIATEANVELANYYYNQKDYDKAIEYYGYLNASDLSAEKRAEVNFKEGYCLFVKKEFEQAAVVLAEGKDVRNEYYYPSNYYYGMTQFFLGDLDRAINGFERVSNSKKYAPYVPYYLTQIYFNTGEYQKVINYAEPKLEEKNLQNKKEIHHLIGQAYFETRQYSEALPHLEYYESRSGKMRAEDFYQLGFVQYQLGQCENAVKNLKELRNIESEMGQQAYYYMADCYLKSGDYTSARTALKGVSKMDFNTSIRDEALYNFGKLSAEMNYDPEAVTALQSVPNSSSHYNNAQTLLGKLFIHTRDYANAIQTLEEMPSISPTLKEAYQSVTLSRAIQLMNDGNLNEAIAHLDKSLKYSNRPELKAQALFWKGELLHYKKQYQASINLYDQFFKVAKSAGTLPTQTSVAMGNYNQGYNYLKLNKYTNAQGHFSDAINSIQGSSSARSDAYTNSSVLSDALLRAGDCAFKRNLYDVALGFYNQSIESKKAGFVYAIYQKAIIRGLQGQHIDKIVLLENITNKYSDSQFADDALLQLAITYQETGSPQQAIPVLTKIVDERNENSSLVNEALLRLGLISYNNGDANSALNYYKKIFERNPDPTITKEAMAAIEEIYIRDLGQPDAYLAFVDNLPGYDMSDYKRDSLNFVSAENKYENGDYEKAISGFDDYLQKFPNGAHRINALYYRAESFGIGEKYNEALSDYEKVIEMGPSKYYGKSLSKAAVLCYNYQQDFNKAFRYYEAFEPVAENEEDQFEAQLGALRSAYRIQNLAGVSRMSNKVIENTRANQDNRATAYFYRGKSFYDMQNLDSALADFNQVSRLTDNVLAAEARYLIAQIYFQGKEYEVAKQLCLNVNRESSNYPNWVARSIILLSDIHVAEGDLFNARAALEAVVENFKGDEQILNTAKEKLASVKQKETMKSRISNDQLKTGQLELIDTSQKGNQ